MDDTKATEANAETIAPQEPKENEVDPALVITALEAEKEKILEERENYKKAYLKEVEKNKQDNGEESEEDRIRRVTRETLQETRLAEIDKEREELLQKALKERDELKLALKNRTTGSPASMGGHSETVAPTDTRVTPEQLAYFKSRNWSDADIERYKRNLAKNSR